MNALDRLAQRLIERGISHDANGDRLTIDCPAHKSSSGTTLHATREDGKVLIHCFAGCKTRDVLSALDLDFHDLYDDRLPKKPANTSRDHGWRDAKGEVYGFTTKQVDPETGAKKGFTPITRDPETGRWIHKSSPQLKTALYRLPEFLEAVAEGREVALTEGEKDADTLWSLGIPATTNAGGAKNFTDAHAKQFLGVHVTVYLDNDPAGNDRARIFPMLAEYAASLKMFRPPTEGMDLTEHLEAGHSLEELEEVQPPSEMTETPLPSSWEPVDLALVLSAGYQAPRASIGSFGGNGGLFYAGEVNTIAGKSGTGKSWIAASVVAEHLIHGDDCLYVDHESSASVISHRLKLLGVPVEKIIHHLTYVAPSDPHTVSGDAWDYLLSREYTVAVIDGVTAAMSLYGGGTNEQDAVAKWFTDVPTPLARKTGAAVITVDHVSKDGERSGFAVGSQHKRAAVGGTSFNVTAAVPLRPGQVGELHLTIGKDRHGDVMSRALLSERDEPVAAVLKFDASEDETMRVTRDGALVTSVERTRNLDRQNILGVLNQHADGLNGNAIHSEIGGKKSRVTEVLKEMVDDGSLTVEEGPRRSHIYKIPTSSGSLRLVPRSPIGGDRREPVTGKGQESGSSLDIRGTSEGTSEGTSQPAEIPADDDVWEPQGTSPVSTLLIDENPGNSEGTSQNPYPLAAQQHPNYPPDPDGNTVWTGLLADGTVNPEYKIRANGEEFGQELVPYSEWERRMRVSGRYVEPTPGFTWTPLNRDAS